MCQACGLALEACGLPAPGHLLLVKLGANACNIESRLRAPRNLTRSKSQPRCLTEPAPAYLTPDPGRAYPADCNATWIRAQVPIIEKKAIPIAPTIPMRINNSKIILTYIGHSYINVKYK